MPEIKGFLPTSMLDWEGRVISTIFLGGCNLRCSYCHNSELVERPSAIDSVPWSFVEEQLVKNKDWLDGVCVSGGEPTLEKNIRPLLKEFKALGLPVKIDTNGTRPEIIDDLLGDNLLDAVALDIKTRFDKYEFCGEGGVDKKIKRTARLIADAAKQGRVVARFRTTLVPGVAEKEDAVAIARYLAGISADSYLLQQFRPQDVLEPKMALVDPFPKAYLESTAEICRDFLPTKVKA